MPKSVKQKLVRRIFPTPQKSPLSFMLKPPISKDRPPGNMIHEVIVLPHRNRDAVLPPFIPCVRNLALV
eukprot:4647622-Pyramimonas_sp.AAC.1